jgi:hypothetical protein
MLLILGGNMVDSFGNVYDVPAVARRLRVDQTTVTHWCRTGVLKQGEDFFVLPKRGSRQIYRFTQEQFDRLIGNPPTSH